MEKSNHLQVVSLNQMWETFNTEPIKELVANNIHFESHWGPRPIKGKTMVLDHLVNRLKSIRSAVNRGEIEIRSSVARKVDGEINEYFLLLYHIIRGQNFESLIRVSVKNGLINRMSVEPVKRRFNIQPMDSITNEIL
jgi:hypothetical protein